MSALTIRNSRGLVVDVEAISATDAKNAFGAVLEKAASYGIVAITKRDKARAVVLSIEEFEALMARVPDPLASLRAEFDALVTGMQKRPARAAGRALFKATPAELGRVAKAGARKRG